MSRWLVTERLAAEDLSASGVERFRRWRRTAGYVSSLSTRTNYFRHGASKATFRYLHQFALRKVLIWLRHKHSRSTWKWLRRRYLPRWWPTDGATVLFDPATVAVTRYLYRGTKIVTPWAAA